MFSNHKRRHSKFFYLICGAGAYDGVVRQNATRNKLTGRWKASGFVALNRRSAT